jgi:myo-inositol 2-dehydrogenase/D-chiro-inositol 1-dehydrogenase
MGFEHIRNIALLPDAEVTALADPHQPSREWGLKTVGREVHVFEDYRDLLAADVVDAVVISTPNFTHARILEDIFQYPELHILVEKPLCTDLSDCRVVEERASTHRGIVWVGMEYRYMPPVAEMVSELRSGRLGQLQRLAIREYRFPFLPKVADWNRFNRNTGGTLVEKCCHFFDLMNLIVEDRPKRVYASGAQDVNHLDERYDGETPDILDNAFVIVDYEAGVRAMLDLCMFAEAARDEQEITVIGDRGLVECSIPSGDVAVGIRDGRHFEKRHVSVDQDVLEAGFHHGATYYQHEAFLHAIRSGSPPDVDVRAGLLAVAIGDAAQQSIAEGRPIEMAELGL